MTNTPATLLLLALAAVSTMTASAEQATGIFIPSSPSNLRGDWNGRIKPVGVDTHDTASLEGFRLRGHGGTAQTHNIDISDEDENDESMNPEASQTASPASDTAIPPNRRRILKSAKKTNKRAKQRKADPKFESLDPALFVRTPGTSDPESPDTPSTSDPVSPNTKGPVAIETVRTEVPRDNIPFITEILLPEYNRSDDNDYEFDEEDFPGSNVPIFNREGFLTDYPTSDNNNLEEDYFDTAQTEAPGDSIHPITDIFKPEYHNRDTDGYNEENFPGSNAPNFHIDYFDLDNQFDNGSERVKSTLEAFDKAIEMSGSGASSDSLQLKYVPESPPGVGCPGDVDLLKQKGGKSLMTSAPILDAVKITHQDTSTVTVDLYQVWGRNNAPGYPVDSFFYHFHKPGKRFWGNVECYEETSVPYSASEKVETIEIACNAGNSYATLELCVVDDISHGSLVPGDSSTTIVPKQCNREVSPTEAAVCYTLEINCQPPSEDGTC
jgi:hypothetical protein